MRGRRGQLKAKEGCYDPPRREEEAGAPILDASFSGKHRALNDRALARMLLRYPLMTLKAIAAIHFEAVRLMFKGVRRHPHA
jgi:DUF1365 family protein